MENTITKITPEEAVDNWNRRPDNWIPVTERLPEYPRDVLIWKKNAGTYIGYYNNLDEFKCWMMDAGKKVTNVTHWMPLPEPPKEVL